MHTGFHSAGKFQKFGNEDWLLSKIGKILKDIPIPRDSEKGFPLIEVKEFHLDWSDVVLKNETVVALKKILQEFDKSEILATYGIKPKQKLLFCGHPGTGKTLTAQLMSSLLGYPMVYVRFDSIVSSSNLKRIFNFFDQGRWVVLFDEFDDHFEQVNNFLQMLDNFNGDSLIIAATNHPSSRRRFDDILYFDIPDKQRRKLLFEKYLKVISKCSTFDTQKLCDLTDKMTPSEISLICFESIKNCVSHGRDVIEMDDVLSAIREQKRRNGIEKKKEKELEDLRDQIEELRKRISQLEIEREIHPKVYGIWGTLGA